MIECAIKLFGTAATIVVVAIIVLQSALIHVCVCQWFSTALFVRPLAISQ